MSHVHAGPKSHSGKLECYWGLPWISGGCHRFCLFAANREFRMFRNHMVSEQDHASGLHAAGMSCGLGSPKVFGTFLKAV